MLVDTAQNIPHRHDLNRNSLINLEIQAFNKKLNKMAKIFSHVAVIEINLNRKHFTRHGMHLNNSGKECLSKLIATQICRLVNGKNKNVPVIPLAWKDKSTDKQNTENSLSEQETTSPINLNWNKPDSTITKEKSLNRDITRNRKLPVTRSNEFLW